MRRKRLREDYDLDELTISCPGTPKRVKCSIPLSSSDDDKDAITEDECVAKSITPAKSEECQSEEESDLLVDTEVSRCYSQLGADSSDEKMMSFEGSEEESKEYNVDSDPNVIDESLVRDYSQLGAASGDIWLLLKHSFCSHAGVDSESTFSELPSELSFQL
ncbi:hypothetical protein ROZALSC1DRAFT_25958 [Rozella allomycis CSF55]|uniref:Uncharacterized protein n=1 Tax=Rozella allomycis (strain CSF55) TaxID=988480 RepID=A0A4P9YAK1_ROZAC|nr:hypothetical protein ROZALSC1DRAFT_25958 [Rozella allomycis CSF55]